ncbi:MAG: hypothetical protein ACNYPD_06730 [Candidatus Halichondribacter symbioticus]
MLLFILGACAYNFPEPQTFAQQPPGPPITPAPDNGTLEEDVQNATTGFLTQTEGDNLNAGIDFDNINNEAGRSGIVGRLQEIFTPDAPSDGNPIVFSPRAGQGTVSKGVDFNLVLAGSVSATESLNDQDFAFMGYGQDGFQTVSNNTLVASGFRLVGYAGYNLNSDAPSVAITASATYNGNLGVIAVSDNTATEGLLNAENYLNISTDIVLTANFTDRTLTSPVTPFANDLGSVQVKGTFTGGETALGGTVDFILPSIFTRDNNAAIPTTLQGVVNEGLAIGAFHGSDASVAIVGGFVARPR